MQRLLLVVVEPGFNEAPAERGGKPAASSSKSTREEASMRPPLNAGENSSGRKAVQGENALQ